jgi:tetratricopeptide (TPR) repeat protein/predicted Ser/Thr protein kinase
MAEAPRAGAREILAALSTIPRGEWESARQSLAGQGVDGRLGELLENLFLLTASERSTSREEPGATVPMPGGAAAAAAPAAARDHIGSYRIIRELGRGGFGVVYLAERADRLFERQVAIKLLKTGREHRALIQRFEAERRILALLDHPNIAQLLDAGTTPDGEPYFVMEYVDGVTLTEYASEHGLDSPAKLRLFLPIAEAVEFAHQRLVVHRDLKPSNVMVTRSGDVKLLDFGIAKLLDTELPGTLAAITAPGGAPMTPSYASPEQIRGEPVSTRSDVFSMGVILYELIAGRLPYSDTTIEGVLRAILHDDPPAPTRVTGSKRDGELDAIVLTTLEKDPARRYASAGQLKEDIERYLSGLPVRAHHDSPAYRARKFVRRHRAGVAAAALVIISLVGGIIMTARQAQIAQAERSRAEERAQEAGRERRRAEEQAELARRREAQAEQMRQQAQTRSDDVRGLANDLLSDLQETVSTLPGGSSAREQLVSRAIDYLRRLERDAAGEPELEAQIAVGYRKLGDLYGMLYRPGNEAVRRALDSYRQAIARLERLLSVDGSRFDWKIELAAGYVGVGSSLSKLRQIREGLSAVERALALTPDPLRVPSGLKAEAAGVRAEALLTSAQLRFEQTGQTEGATALAREAISLIEVTVAAEPKRGSRLRSLANAEGILALILIQGGSAKQALPHIERAQSTIRKELEQSPGDFLAQRDAVAFRGLLGTGLSALGRTEEAIAAFESGLESARRLRETDAGNILVRENITDMTSWLGQMYAGTGDTKKSRERFDEMLRAAEELTKADARNARWLRALLSAHMGIGDSYADERNYQQALEPYRNALTASQRMAAVSPNDFEAMREVAFAYQRLAEAGMNLKDNAGALQWQLKALELHERTVAAQPRHPDYLVALTTNLLMLASIYRGLGRDADIGTSLERAMRAAEKAHEVRPGDAEVQQMVSESYSLMGQHLFRAGLHAKAIEMLQRSTESYSRLAEAHPNIVRYRRSRLIAMVHLGHAQLKQAADPTKSAEERARAAESGCASLRTTRDEVERMKQQGQKFSQSLLQDTALAEALKTCP